jgi:acyl-CoA synthetase (AMP-forming)/AMP-acid ligase II
VLAALGSAPDHTALEFGTRAVSRGELLAMVHRLAGGLRDAGLGPGVGVGLVLALSPEAYAVHLAAHTLGCRVAQTRPGWSPRQLADALGQVDAVVTDAPRALDQLPLCGPVLSLDDLLVRADQDGHVPQMARADDVARLTYTSGSMGQPKACAHTYEAMSLAYQPDRWAPALRELLTRFERCLVPASLAGPVMFTYLGRCLVAGGTAVIPAGLGLAEAIERYRITAAMMPPARLDQVIRSRADLSSLRAVVLGGSPAGAQLLRAATERLGPVVWQGYGQAEAGVISMLTPQDIAAGHLTSVGRPMPAVEVAIRDGEIVVRSPHVMAGYWNDPEQTRQVLSEGWIRTRDLGYLDADGLLHLTGRARDVIMVNAEVCYAGAIERVLAGHPGVVQAYVVGAPDPETGEAVHAFVVPAGDQAPDLATLADLVRQRLSANSVPTSITVIREVPVNDSGKPDKRALLPGGH